MYVRKHYKKWQAVIRRKGIKTITKSFISKAECSKWARNIERELDRGNFIDFTEAKRVTLGDILQRYIREDKHKRIKSWRMYEFRIGILLKDTIADTNTTVSSNSSLSSQSGSKTYSPVTTSGNTTPYSGPQMSTTSRSSISGSVNSSRSGSMAGTSR